MNNTWNMHYLTADLALYAAEHPGYGIRFGDKGEVEILDTNFKVHVRLASMSAFRHYLTDYAKDAYSVKRK